MGSCTDLSSFGGFWISILNVTHVRYHEALSRSFTLLESQKARVWVASLYVWILNEVLSNLYINAKIEIKIKDINGLYVNELYVD
jgi:hypothetical protein